MALLLASVGVIEWKAAGATALLDGEVQWLDSSGDLVSFYKPGTEVARTTATFFLSDPALETVNETAGTWTNISRSVPSGEPFSLATGKTGPSANLTTTAYSLAPGHSYSTTSPSSTPLDGIPTVTVDGLTYTVISFGAGVGTFTLLNAVDAGSTVVATFRYHVQDVYPANNAGGTPLPSENRARITGTSDSAGECVAINEVDGLGSANASSTSRVFRGSIHLSSDPLFAGPGDGKLWVQDSEAITVSYYQSDHATVIAATTATIDGSPPTISNVSPEFASPEVPAGVSSTSPLVRFTIEDHGSGFSEASPFTAAGLEINGCPVLASELAAPFVSPTRLDLEFHLSPASAKWTDPPIPTCAARVSGGFGVTPNTTFTWSIMAADLAGNVESLTMGLVITVLEDVDIPLLPGFNLIGIPIRFSTTTTFVDVAQHIAAQGGEVSSIYAWNAFSQGFVSWTASSPNVNNLEVQVGQGYFVRVERPPQGGALRVAGFPMVESVPLDFARGFNLISVPYPTVPYNVGGFVQAISEAGGTASSVLTWNGAAQVFEAWVAVSPAAHQFGILSTAGYFVQVTQPTPTPFVP